jgi:hypothetical protein
MSHTKRENSRGWGALGPLWKAQASMCGVRRDFYRMLARSCDLPFAANPMLGGLAWYFRLQASSCDLQGRTCLMLASVCD